MDHVSAERWMPVLGWAGFYEVSDLGHVRSVDRLIIRSDGQTRRFCGKMLAAQLDDKGYLRVSLSRDGNPVQYQIHRLVLEAFIGPCPVGKECLHANDVSDDNRLANLRWDHHDTNQQQMVANGHHFNANKTHCPRGHEYTPANTYAVRNGRECRACRKLRRTRRSA